MRSKKRVPLFCTQSRLPCWRCRRSLRAIGHPWDVDCYRDGEKDNELASGALRKPGRGDGGYGKKDQDDCEQWRKEAGRLAVPVPGSLMEFWAEAKTLSGCGKPFVSANSRFFKNDLLQLNADLLTMMRIGDHHNEFTPRDRDELSRQRQ